MAGHLIAIDGVDGAGKSTLARALQQELNERGYRVVIVREPGGTALGEAIRPLLSGQALPDYELDDRAEALLFLAARAQIYREVIEPKLAADEWVIVDRGLHSTMIYQGLGRRLGAERMRSFSLFATHDRQADIIFNLRLSAATARQRIAARGDRVDRIEAPGQEFWQRVHQGYAELASIEARVVDIDAEGSVDQALAAALAALDQRLLAVH
jgi:dTMP kinase